MRKSFLLKIEIQIIKCKLRCDRDEKGQDGENDGFILCAQIERWKIKFLTLRRQSLKWDTGQAFKS